MRLKELINTLENNSSAEEGLLGENHTLSRKLCCFYFLNFLIYLFQQIIKKTRILRLC